MKITLKEKKFLVAKYFELLLLQGNGIIEYMGKPLTYWNYTVLIKEIIRQEEDVYGSTDFLLFYPDFKKYINK
jgi:hypothetical protein